MQIKVTINGKLYERDIPPSRTLLHFLREDLGLTGTKEGCGAGECGACTVLLNGKAVQSCLILAAEANNATVDTIEGEASCQEVSRLQQAFITHHAVQCGFCTSGMIMAAKDLIHTYPKPTEEQIRIGLSGNLCRCTGYKQIIEAILDVTGQLDLQKEVSDV
jgi:carbon-monoxide dehydrogenase small subunit